MTTAAPASSNQSIVAAHDAHQSINYARFPVAMVRGRGSELFDADGKRYIDLFAGFGGPILGHCHPDLVAALTEQAGLLWHAGNQFHTEPQTRLAERLAKHGFGGRSFFSHSGADANEAALKLARLYGLANPNKAGQQRYKTISATRSFHGRSFGTMGATGNPKVREGFGPLPPGFVNVGYNDLDAIRREIDDLAVAVILEPIQGEGGVNLPDPNYFAQLRELCDEHDLLLIVDEVWCGCGRTGKWFGHQHWGITPDIMTMGKGIGGGLAVGAMCAQPRVAELYDWRKYGASKHATTLGGNCIGMAVAARVFDVIERDALLPHVTQLGQHVVQRLGTGAAADSVREVRGRGLFLGVELAEGGPSGNDVVQACLDRGLVINATGGNVLRLAPALTIDQPLLDEGLTILEDVLRG